MRAAEILFLVAVSVFLFAASYRLLVTVCRHSERSAINEALVSGVPRLTVAKTYGLKEPAVRYHAGKHLPATLIAAREAGSFLATLPMINFGNPVRPWGSTTIKSACCI